MLKKLLKYDWKSVSLLLLILHGILLVYTLIGRLGIAFGISGPRRYYGLFVTTVYGIAAGALYFCICTLYFCHCSSYLCIFGNPVSKKSLFR